MNNVTVLAEIEAKIKDAGGVVSYADFLAMTPVAGRVGLVNDARKYFEFKLSALPEGGLAHTVSLRNQGES